MSAQKVEARNISLDGIRGLAISLVVVYHAFNGVETTYQWEAVITWVAHSSWVGVDLFFVLSGFLITGILLRTRDQAGYFRRFYMRRFLRIFPIYYSFLCVLFLGSLFHPAWRQLHLIWHLFYLSNVDMALHRTQALVAHLWSLSVEEQFYIVWPALIFLIPRGRTILMIGTIFCLLVLGRQYFGLIGSNNYLVYAMLHLDGLLLGSALAVFNRASPGDTRAAGVATAVILAFGGILSFEVLRFHGLNWWEWKGIQYLNYSLVAACGASFVTLALYSGDRSPINRVMRCRPLVALGKYSYAIYILQTPFDAELRNFNLRPSGFAGAILYAVFLGGASFVCALGTWRFLEQPCIALKDRWFS